MPSASRLSRGTSTPVFPKTRLGSYETGDGSEPNESSDDRATASAARLAAFTINSRRVCSLLIFYSLVVQNTRKLGLLTQTT